MAGLYIHIPFCKSRCLYCDFYSTTSLDMRQRYVDALCRELELRGEWNEEGGEWKVEGGRRIETVYLGGGTPSQLSTEQLQQLFLYINKVYDISPDAEVTMEVNPDDVTDGFAQALSQLPINRISMGAQTFDDKRLQFLHRRHTTAQVPLAVERLRHAGIRNISVDLMYGFPNETLSDWDKDITSVLSLQVEHLSAYALQYEEGTPLYRLLQRGEVSEVDDELSRNMYYLLKDRLAAAGYEHYEISNFAKKGFRSRHNSSYWNQTPYIGIGAAAHSFDGQNRQWNIADIRRYVAGIESEKPVEEQEQLTPDNHYNEVVMTALRTCEGLALNKLSRTYRDYCLQQAQQFLYSGLLRLQNQRLILSREGLFVSDMVMTELMRVS